MPGRAVTGRAALVALALGLAACATVPATNTPNAVRVPATPLELGDWRGVNSTAVAQHFEREVAQRYAAGLQLSAASGDLRRYEFNCAVNNDTTGRGDPPDQICRRTTSANNCTHTWQVHLYDANGASVLTRARALYDRRCGGDGLLGGPG